MKSKVIIVVVTIFVLVLAALSLIVYQKINYIADRDLGAEIRINATWTSVTLEKVISINHDVNQLNVDVAEPFEFRPGDRSLKAPDGTEFLPEVEVVTENGDILPLEFSGGRFYRGHRFIGFRDDRKLIKGLRIREFRIRSEYEFVTPTIWLSSYNIEDMP